MTTTPKESPRVLIRTQGCKVNQYDSERIRTLFRRRGYQSFRDQEEADPELIVINTCSVTSESDRKGRQMIRHLIRRYPHARIMVTGCYAERKPDDILHIDGVDDIVPIENQEQWVEQVSEELGWGCEDQDALWYPQEGIDRFEEHTRAFVKIQDGCDLKCTFCSIPQSRGQARSRPLHEVIDECQRLVQHGYPEIVLCGICLGQYGLGMEVGLPDLVHSVAEIPGIKRVRISSLEPQHASEALFEVMQEKQGIVCPHLHLPLQSGSNRILRRMKRPYTVEAFLSCLQKAQSRLKHFGVSTDIMVGFPDESESDFQQTLEAVRQCAFHKVHSFRFSAREDTPAMRMKGHLHPGLIEERRKELDRVASETAHAYKQTFLGKTMKVLTEQVDGTKGTGFTVNYLRVDYTTDTDISPGEEISVSITGFKKGRLLGQVVEPCIAR